MAERTNDKTVTEVLHEQHELIKDMFDQVGAAMGPDRAGLFDCLRAILAVHETAEEELVHPMVRTMGEDATAAVRLRLDEERAAKRMLADLERIGPDGDGFDDLMAEFEAAVIEHAEAEEEEVFPFITNGIDAEQQRTMAATLLAAERLAPTHPHPNGPDGAVGNMLVGPFASMVDRVKDAIKKRSAA